MFTTLVSAAVFTALAARGVRADDGFSIATPQFTQCQDVHITWNGGVAPYNLLIVPNDDPCEQVVVDLGDHQGQSITWKVGIPAGQQVLLSLQDANEDEAWSNTITVGGSDDGSCLPGAVVSASTSVAPSSAAPSASSASPTAATTLTVPPDFSSPAAAVAPAPSASTSEPPAIAVGAANAGLNPLSSSNGASSAMQKLSGSVLALGAVASFFVFSL